MPVRLYTVVWVIFVCSLAAYARGAATPAPIRYALVFTPDFEKKTLAGDETIEMQLPAAISSFDLDAEGIAFGAVRVVSAGIEQEAVVSARTDRPVATISTKNPIGPGRATIRIEFRAPIRDTCCGFYAARSGNDRFGVLHSNARRAFPSFDDPAMKAKFDISVVADVADLALSNGAVISDTPGPEPGKHTVRFSTTASISTYLVTLVVGPLRCRSGSSDGIPVRICGAPRDERLAAFALDGAEEMLRFYDRYFGVKYPFGKLDIAGLPDIPGAMESAGCILALDSSVFVDPNSSEDTLANTAIGPLAHEIGHQWLGDLVTLKSWDEFWLNEGMATWIAYKAAGQWKPNWHVELKELARTNEAMNLDALPSTPPVRSLNPPSAISYDKAAAVLRMVEAYTGEESFRNALRRYVKRYAFGNVRSEDLWNELAATTRKPVDHILADFITQPGVPVVMVHSSCDGDKSIVRLQQEGHWTIPVCVRNGAQRECRVLGGNEERVVLRTCGPVFANAGANGYYRSVYERKDLLALAGTESFLTAPERISLVNDAWAAVRSSRLDLGDFLTVAKSARNTPAVLPFVNVALAYLSDSIASEADRAALDRWRGVTVETCDSTRHAELVQKLLRSTDAKERMDTTSRLARCDAPDLVEQTWSLLFSGKLTNAEARNLRSSLFLRRAARPIALRLLLRDWKDIEKHGLITAGLFNQDLAQFCDLESRDEIARFFASVAVPPPAKAPLERALDRIGQCAAERERLQPQLHVWLISQ